MKLRAVATIALVLLVALPARAFHEDDAPLLASGGGPGVGWASFSFATDGALVAVDVLAEGTATTMLAAYLFDARESPLFGFSFSTSHHPTDGAITRVDLVPGWNVHTDTTRPAPADGRAGIGVTLNDPDAGGAPVGGAYKLLVFVAGDASAWTWTFRGGAGARLLATDGGADTSLWNARDFVDGGAHAERYADGTGARAQVGTTRALDVDDRLFGSAFTANFKIACAAACVGAPSSDALTVRAPGASLPTACHCSFWGERAGSYTFELDGADASTTAHVLRCFPAGCAGAFALDDVVLVGLADARLPP